MTWATAQSVAGVLNLRHYLGASKRGFAWDDDYGVVVFAKPTSRHLPQDGTWLELVRWCLFGGVANSGSMQWRRMRAALQKDYPHVTTVVSYSDPSQGHTGALYRACNWQWCPTWQRLRPPPTANGSWKDGKQQAVKDRWVFVLAPDARRDVLLRVNDESLQRRGIPTYKQFAGRTP